MTTNLSNQDYQFWLEKTAKLLRNSQFAEIDIPSLAEELEDMVKAAKNAFKSNLRIVLIHLLKYKYQPEKRSDSWLSSVVEHRTRLLDAFEESPSLQRYFEEVFAQCYTQARRNAAFETRMKIDEFPATCPFTPEQVLDIEYLPE